MNSTIFDRLRVKGLNKKISIKTSGKTVEGILKDVDKQSNLVVETTEGELYILWKSISNVLVLKEGEPYE